MAWFVLARVLFLAAVTYSAIVLRPFHSDWIPNAAFGVGLASLLVAFEIRLKNASVTNMLGAMIGGAVGLAAAKTISAALFWTNTGDQRIAFLHAFTLLALTYLGLLMGGRKGEWLEPTRLIGLFRSTGPRAAIASSTQRDHRWPGGPEERGADLSWLPRGRRRRRVVAGGYLVTDAFLSRISKATEGEAHADGAVGNPVRVERPEDGGQIGHRRKETATASYQTTP